MTRFASKLYCPPHVMFVDLHPYFSELPLEEAEEEEAWSIPMRCCPLFDESITLVARSHSHQQGSTSATRLDVALTYSSSASLYFVQKRHNLVWKQKSYVSFAPTHCMSDLGHHWFRKWLVTCSALNYYLNLCWLTLLPMNKLLRKFNPNTKIFFGENTCQNCQPFLFFRPEYVKFFLSPTHDAELHFSQDELKQRNYNTH